MITTAASNRNTVEVLFLVLSPGLGRKTNRYYNYRSRSKQLWSTPRVEKWLDETRKVLSCVNGKVELMPISDNELYTFSYYARASAPH
jgi:hypothetical protein